jgi:hypothetical protein
MVRRKGMYGVSCEAENATGKILNISCKKKTIEMQTRNNIECVENANKKHCCVLWYVKKDMSLTER